MKTALASLFLLAATGGLSAADDEAKKEWKALAGSWKIASMEVDGKAVPKADLPDLSFKLHADGKADVKAPGGEFQTMSIIDPSKNPKTLDIEYLGGDWKGMKQYGIYKLDGDRFTAFSTPAGGKVEDRPKKFDSSTAKGALIVWERVKEEKKR